MDQIKQFKNGSGDYYIAGEKIIEVLNYFFNHLKVQSTYRK